MSVKHIGLFMVRNEPDVALDAYREHAGYMDEMVIQDGSEEGQTWTWGKDIRPAPAMLIFDDLVLRPGERWTDAHRNHALQAILKRWHDENVWVTLCHADEFWQDDPRMMAEWADADGATFTVWGEYRFHLHPEDRRMYAADGKAPWPIQEIVRHWCGPFFETRQFKLRNHQVYEPGRDHSTLPGGPGTPVRWPHIPRYRHYPYRSPAQCKLAYQDKVVDRYWQPDHAWLKDGDPFVEALPKPVNSPLSAWDNRGVYDGTLPNPEPFFKG